MKTTVVLASNNAGKLREFHNMFADSDWDLVSQSEYCVDDADETGLSFIENAIIKARHACEKTGLPAIADDSGLAIDYLKGAPGIYSARYAGEHGNDKANNQKVISALAGQAQNNRRARFICALAFMQHAEDPTPIVCQASWEGFILEKERGEHGFGYDPLFWLPERNCSSAELPAEIKNTISHRAKALQLLFAALKKHGCYNSGMNKGELNKSGLNKSQ
jgi:XTP/dITP diphosphohydrolase